MDCLLRVPEHCRIVRDRCIAHAKDDDVLHGLFGGLQILLDMEKKPLTLFVAILLTRLWKSFNSRNPCMVLHSHFCPPRMSKTFSSGRSSETSYAYDASDTMLARRCLQCFAWFTRWSLDMYHCKINFSNMTALKAHINQHVYLRFDRLQAMMTPIVARPDICMHLRHRSVARLMLDRGLCSELATRCAFCHV